jgi:hypothetical protein
MSHPVARSLSVWEILTGTVQQFKQWCRAGDPPPRTQVKSIYLMIFLNIFGLIALTVWALAVLEIKFNGVFTSLVPLLAVAFLTLCPGIYGAWVSFCCWRRVYRYDWFMIPHFE